MRSKLTRDPLFGAASDRRFSEVLALDDGTTGRSRQPQTRRAARETSEPPGARSAVGHALREGEGQCCTFLPALGLAVVGSVLVFAGSADATTTGTLISGAAGLTR